ncbi:unnamed protein product, partial [Amoebophrya sp. A25]
QVSEVLGSGQGSDVYRVSVVNPSDQEHDETLEAFEGESMERGLPDEEDVHIDHSDVAGSDGQNLGTRSRSIVSIEGEPVDQNGEAPSRRPQGVASLALKFFEPRKWIEADIASGRLENVDQSVVRQFFRWGRAGMRHFLTGLELLPDGVIEYLVSLWTLETVCAFLRWTLGLPSETNLQELLDLARGKTVATPTSTANQNQQHEEASTADESGPSSSAQASVESAPAASSNGVVTEP